MQRITHINFNNTLVLLFIDLFLLYSGNITIWIFLLLFMSLYPIIALIQDLDTESFLTKRVDKLFNSWWKLFKGLLSIVLILAWIIWILAYNKYWLDLQKTEILVPIILWVASIFLFIIFWLIINILWKIELSHRWPTHTLMFINIIWLVTFFWIWYYKIDLLLNKEFINYYFTTFSIYVVIIWGLYVLLLRKSRKKLNLFEKFQKIIVTTIYILLVLYIPVSLIYNKEYILGFWYILLSWHILADIINPSGVPLLFPLKERFKLKMFSTGSEAEERFSILLGIINFWLIIFWVYTLYNLSLNWFSIEKDINTSKENILLLYGGILAFIIFIFHKDIKRRKTIWKMWKGIINLIVKIGTLIVTNVLLGFLIIILSWNIAITLIALLLVDIVLFKKLDLKKELKYLNYGLFLTNNFLTLLILCILIFKDLI